MHPETLTMPRIHDRNMVWPVNVSTLPPVPMPLMHWGETPWYEPTNKEIPNVVICGSKKQYLMYLHHRLAGTVYAYPLSGFGVKSDGRHPDVSAGDLRRIMLPSEFFRPVVALIKYLSSVPGLLQNTSKLVGAGARSPTVLIDEIRAALPAYDGLWSMVYRGRPPLPTSSPGKALLYQVFALPDVWLEYETDKTSTTEPESFVFSLQRLYAGAVTESTLGTVLRSLAEYEESRGPEKLRKALTLRYGKPDFRVDIGFAQSAFEMRTCDPEYITVIGGDVQALGLRKRRTGSVKVSGEVPAGDVVIMAPAEAVAGEPATPAWDALMTKLSVLEAKPGAVMEKQDRHVNPPMPPATTITPPVIAATPPPFPAQTVCQPSLKASEINGVPPPPDTKVTVAPEAAATLQSVIAPAPAQAAAAGSFKPTITEAVIDVLNRLQDRLLDDSSSEAKAITGRQTLRLFAEAAPLMFQLVQPQLDLAITAAALATENEALRNQVTAAVDLATKRKLELESRAVNERALRGGVVEAEKQCRALGLPV